MKHIKETPTKQLAFFKDIA